MPYNIISYILNQLFNKTLKSPTLRYNQVHGISRPYGKILVIVIHGISRPYGEILLIVVSLNIS